MSNSKVYRREDGNYTFYYKGKHYTRATRKDAEKLYSQLAKSAKYQQLIETYGKTTISTLMEDWLEIQKGITAKASTYDRQEQIYENQIKPFLGKTQVPALTTPLVQKWLNELSDKGYSKSTIKKSKEYLQAALRFYKVLNKFDDNPFEGVKIPAAAPSKDKSDIACYTQSEIKQIYEAATKTHTVLGKKEYIYRLGDAIIVLGETGMRSGEFLALTWDDVDFKHSTISISKTRQHVKNRKGTTPKYIDVINEPKTKSSIRTIPMSKKCKAALKRIEKINGSFEYVSSTEKGTPISVRNFARTFRQILYAAGMDKAVDAKGKTVNKIYGPHSMRHSFATHLINEKNANIAIVSSLLGHADVSVTINKYVHTEDKDKAKIIKLLD